MASVKILAAALLLFVGCGRKTPPSQVLSPRRSEPVLPERLYSYAEPPWPAHFLVESEGYEMQEPLVQADTEPKHNLVSDTGATLGRVLFYDRTLSQNKTISCASCHQAAHGFSDARVLSLGFAGGPTGRHSMGLTNARFYGEGRFFWDQRASTLEEQVLMPFLDPVEMGMSLASLVQRVQEAPYYASLFEAAFGDTSITSERIAFALAQFVRSLVSTGSRYDTGRAQVQRRSDPFPNFTEEENLGKKIFVMPRDQGGYACFTCHKGEGFVAALTTTNGLDASWSKDPGYGVVSAQKRDLGTFKVPSLKNVAMRPPYMHDGRFASLEEVIEHYSDTVQAHPNLGIPFETKAGKVVQSQLTPLQKQALIAFLHTLSDPAMLADPKFSDPFAL